MAGDFVQRRDRDSRAVALVTGAGQRLGQRIAVKLATQGYDVAVHYASSKQGAQATVRQVRKNGQRAEAFQADLLKPRAIERMVKAVIKKMGRLDLVVSNAANFEHVEHDKLDLGFWDRAMNLNARAGYCLALHTMGELKRTKGSMVFITCSSTERPFRHYLPYIVSKAAARQLMRTLALELGPDVRVNAVAPGTVLPPQSLPKSTLNHIVRRTLLKRVGEADDIANAVVYLAKARFMTGQEVVVDGGAALYAGD